MAMTVARLHKMLGKLIEDGQGRRPMCVNKGSFYHPLEAYGATILEVTDATPKTICVADDDGWTAINKDGSEKLRKVVVLGGGHERS